MTTNLLLFSLTQYHDLYIEGYLMRFITEFVVTVDNMTNGTTEVGFVYTSRYRLCKTVLNVIKCKKLFKNTEIYTKKIIVVVFKRQRDD